MKLERGFKLLIILLLSLTKGSFAQNFVWDIQSGVLTDRSGANKLDVQRTNTRLQKSAEGYSLVSSDNNESVRIPYMEKDVPLFNLTINFKGKNATVLTLPSQSFKVQFNNNNIIVNFEYIQGSQKKRISKSFQLNGLPPYNSITMENGDFNKYNITIDGKAGLIRLTINDQPDEKYVQKIDKFSSVNFESNLNLRLHGEVNYIEIGKKLQQASLKTSNIKTSSAKRSASLRSLYSPMDFADGYPASKHSVLEQLMNYPDPRYDSKFHYKRNFPWYDITYFSRLHENSNYREDISKQSANALHIMRVLYNKWNYYWEIPVLRAEQTVAGRIYKDTTTVPGKLIYYAGKDQSIETAAILVQIQNNPRHIGLNYNRNLQAGLVLKDNYYLRDKNKKNILHNRKKVLSPLASLDFVYNDAQNSVYYLKNATRFLQRPVNFLNENGEIYSHNIPIDIFRKDPAVAKDIVQRGLNTTETYNGYVQNRLDTAYKNYILRELAWNKTDFSFYNVSAYNDAYWPDYGMRRSSNKLTNGQVYATPSFYPQNPKNWLNSDGEKNGINTIANGRAREIKSGDLFFSPFVSAGWKLEEENLRPAQWLALMKSMVMLGAEFFYVGYFNVTGSSGWPNGKGPNNPRDYAYQIAIPSYAQALFPHFLPFIEKGELLTEPGNNTNFRINASKQYHYVQARKLDNQLLIVGSVQGNVNYQGVVPESEITSFYVNKDKYKINIRKQGSVYLINRTNNSIKVKQLDEWHESSHPSFWNKDTRIELELLTGNWDLVKTEGVVQVGNEFDLSRIISYITLKEKINIPVYDSKVSRISIRMRGKGTVKLANQEIEVSDSKWRDYHITVKSNNLELSPVKGNVEIDYIVY